MRSTTSALTRGKAKLKIIFAGEYLAQSLAEASAAEPDSAQKIAYGKAAAQVRDLLYALRERGAL